ncbi:MAG TPA: hypothetical protein VLV83_06790 [Acidobacteriota bacterium]|nr:hypothetical protein [Acidobacteriota bacterium]
MPSKTFYVYVVFLILVLAGAPAWAQGPGGGPGGPGQGPGQGPPEDFPGFAGLPVERNLVLPQVALGQGVVTTIVLSNMGLGQRMPWLPQPEDIALQGTIHFFDPEGEALTVIPEGGQPTQAVAFELGAAETVFLALTADAPLQTGWALIDVEDGDSNWGFMDGRMPFRGERLMATAYYTIEDGNGVLTQVGVVPATFERGLFQHLLMPAQFGSGLNTGVALVNVDDEALEAELVLRSGDRSVQLTTSIMLQPGQQRARFIDELFPGLEDGFQGVLEVRSGQSGLVALGLLSNQGILTSVPTRHFGVWTQNGPMMP